MLRFDTFELDLDRAELRTAGGEAIKLRPKTFALLQFFATNANRLLSKQELMSAIWPNVHVGEDSLFQAIREIRAALGDKDRQLVKSVSGRGYLFEADIATVDGSPRATQSAPSDDAPPAHNDAWYWLQMTRRPALAVSLVLCFAVGVAFAAPMLVRRLYVPELQTITVVPFEVRTSDAAATAAMAANITDKLTDGLSKIGNIRVLAPQAELRGANATTAVPASTDFIIRGELQRDRDKWEVQARLIDASGQVQWSGGYSVPAESINERLQQSRLTAGIGNPLALRINALTHARLSSPESKIVVEQATAFLNQTNRERFAVAQDLLEKAHAEKPDDVDIAAALSAHLMRGVATVWYPVSENDAIEQRARALLDKAVKQEPNYIPVLQAYCRLLQTINEFAETLVACQNALRFDPWDGLVMFQIGMAQLRLGRFEDALVTFERADTIDTPQVSRWTWPLGAGVTLVFMEKYKEALPWLHQSLAVTPGTGRTHLLIAASLEALGRHDEAREYVAKAMALRPGSNGENIGLPTKNQSPRYMASADKVRDLLITAGLPPK
ncbi:winged helix-turn-helix domain-containing protein [Microbacteriaceae bacterium K1510]|nr:winged helix-turn-helix domain-containing protein [Microbacteriaceae bacterium K1510]